MKLSKQASWRQRNLAHRLRWERAYRKTPRRRAYVKKYLKRTAAVRKAYRDNRRKQRPGAEYKSLRQRRPWKTLFDAKRSNAQKKGVPFSLTAAWFERNYKRGCAITGIAFVCGVGCINPLSATVDRLNSKRGYSPRNCRLVLHAVNALRGSGDDKQMRKIARAIIRAK